MEFKIEDVGLILFDMQSSEDTPINLRAEDELLYIDFVRPEKIKTQYNDGSIIFNKKQVTLLRDALTLMLKNKAFDE